MSSILYQYFNRLKESAFDKNLYFFQYDRDNNNQPFSVHLKLRYDEHRTYDAWGNGLTKDEAYGKALMELIERYTFASITPLNYKKLFGINFKKTELKDISTKHNIPLPCLHPTNTNGVAIHTSKKQALNSALMELIERHTILYSLVKKISPHGKQTKKLSNNQVCQFYYWSSPMNTFVVVGVIQRENGWYFSSGCDFNLDAAIHKSILEINSFLCLKEEASNIKDYRIKVNDIDSFNRYHRYSGDRRIIDFLEEESKEVIPKLDKKAFYYCDIPQPAIFKGLPKFYCVRVINPFVQQLFFDNWNHSYLNPLIFDQDTLLPEYPHIIA